MDSRARLTLEVERLRCLTARLLERDRQEARREATGTSARDGAPGGEAPPRTPGATGGKGAAGEGKVD